TAGRARLRLPRRAGGDRLPRFGGNRGDATRSRARRLRARCPRQRRQDRLDRAQGQPRAHLPRARPECRDGPRPLRAHRSLRHAGTRRDRHAKPGRRPQRGRRGRGTGALPSPRPGRGCGPRVGDNRRAASPSNRAMSLPTEPNRPPLDPNTKQKAAAKTARIPIKVVPATEPLRKPEWIRVRPARVDSRFYEIKRILREHRLHTVCEEAACPNIGECFGKGTATFMIMGDKCTRRCPFCDVGHGRPDPLDADEPLNLARTIAALGLRYVVITSVYRDDLRDGGAWHFVECIRRVSELSPTSRIVVRVHGLRGRLAGALDIREAALPDVMNHYPKSVPLLYRQAPPGSDYSHSIRLM